MPVRTSLAGRIAACTVAVAAVSICLALLAARWLPPVLAGLTAALLAVPLTAWLATVSARPWSNVLRALRDGVMSLKDHDFSISISRPRDEDLGELIDSYNSLGDLLRRERLNLHQRELLLDTVIQTTPLGLVLTNAAGRVVYSNIAARSLLLSGRK